MIDTPGIFHDLPMSAYLSDPAPAPSLSSGCAHTLLARSPFHAWCEHPKNPRRLDGDESAAMDTGSIIHSMLLEQNEECVVVIDAPDFRTKAAQQARDEARAAGKHPILAHKFAAVRALVTAARNYLSTSDLAGILDDGIPEATMLWQDEGTWCRARPDLISGDKGVILHVKTTAGSAEPAEWIRRHLLLDGYDVAAAHYERGAHALGMDRAQSIFFVIEQEPPHGCSLVGLTPALRELAHGKAERASRIWRACLQRNFWPAYPTAIAYAEAPAWALAQAEEEEIRGFGSDELQERYGAQA